MGGSGGRGKKTYFAYHEKTVMKALLTVQLIKKGCEPHAVHTLFLDEIVFGGDFYPFARQKFVSGAGGMHTIF